MGSLFCSSPTPFTPPTTEEDCLSWLRLIRSPRVGPATFLRLLAEYGSAAAALDALPEQAARAGLKDYTPCPLDHARAEWERGLRLGARPLFLGQPQYPPALAALEDPPPVLWVRGPKALRTLVLRPAVALVGARAASALGLRMARKLAAGLGEAGFVVVSGLARGIDKAAHEAALATGTIAVMAGGVDVIYPPENASLANAIAECGVLLSEQPPGLEPQSRHFARRNRLIAGLARAVIVVEAAEGSGSLITARFALDQGREVMAVPGHPLDPRSAGANALIRDGAVLVRSVDDVLAALGPLGTSVDVFDRAENAASLPCARDDLAGQNSDALPDPGRGCATASCAQSQMSGPGQSFSQPKAGGSACEAMPDASLHRARTKATAAVPAPSQSVLCEEVACVNARATDENAEAEAKSRRVLPQDPPETSLGASAEAWNALDSAMIGRQILSVLAASPVAEDVLLRELALPPSEVLSALLVLELDGKIHRQPGGLVARV